MRVVKPPGHRASLPRVSGPGQGLRLVFHVDSRQNAVILTTGFQKAILLAITARLAAAGALAADPGKLPAASTGPVDFARDIYPLFTESCVKCHGPEKAKGHYRMDTKAGAFKPGEHGPNIIPGDSAGSPLMQMVAGLVEDGLMPPPDPKGKSQPLTAQQIGLLRAWIDHGAAWPDGPIPVFVKEITFARDITPILTKSCLECHGAADPKGGLRLDAREAAIKGGKSYHPAVLPGHRAKSPLMIVVTGKDEDLPLPEKHKLDEPASRLIGQWIDQGAK